MDFVNITQRTKVHNGVTTLTIQPSFVVRRSDDLLVNGGEFVAVWDMFTKTWSRDPYHVVEMVDNAIYEEVERQQDIDPTINVVGMPLRTFGNKKWSEFAHYVRQLPDNVHDLDSRVAFQNSEVVKTDYITQRLPYNLTHGTDTPNFDKLFRTLFDPEELEKIMWAIGSIIAGDSKIIQRFFVLYGEPGTGKSTALSLIEDLFGFHVTSFEVKSLTSSQRGFATEPFRLNPLVAIDHDGDLTHIQTNTLLNMLVSHDTIPMNVKYLRVYSLRPNTMLFVATNKPVEITDAMSGLLRRLIDVRPSGRRVSSSDYDRYKAGLTYELGAIAGNCLDKYNELGIGHYDGYTAVDMIRRTNVIYNFMEEFKLRFKAADHVTLKEAWKAYKQYAEDSNVTHRYQYHTFRDEIARYFEAFHQVTRINGVQMRSVFVGYKGLTSVSQTIVSDDTDRWLNLVPTSTSVLRQLKLKAQLASDKGTPRTYWSSVSTTIDQLDETELHYVIPPSNMIVIDFDITVNGVKDLQANIAAAERLPPTFAEASKSGNGIHLYYYYDGDPNTLSRIFAPGVDMLLPVGNMSIRRRLTVANDLPIAVISSGLPSREVPKSTEIKALSPTGLRTVVMRSMNLEYHAGTKPAVEFISKVLHEAYDGGVEYDLSDIKPAVLQFAAKSTHHSKWCMTTMMQTPFVNKTVVVKESDEPVLTFYDIEIFPNLFVISWTIDGVHAYSLVNPSASQVEELVSTSNLVGFFNRLYDNHMIYAAMLGYTVEELYVLSGKISPKSDNAMDARFPSAYGLSYADVYDYSSKRQSLKKWELELGIDHVELEIPWGSMIRDDQIPAVTKYCEWDAIATHTVHNHLAHTDYTARLILASISGLRPNDTTKKHVATIVFGDAYNKKNQRDTFDVPDLSKEFEGYHYDRDTKVSTYRGFVVGEGGYVYVEPGLYHEPILYMDVNSMHPTTIGVINLFGPYTPEYTKLKRARVHVKLGELDKVKELYPEIPDKYLSPTYTKGLSYALKIALNSVYGHTFSKYPNPFNHPDNVDNVVAKRGALFMIDLHEYLGENGIHCIHIKTDSVKVRIPDDKTIDDVIELIKSYGNRYGYQFAVEGVFDNLMLANAADLVGLSGGAYETSGVLFTNPYVYKSLFSGEPIIGADYDIVKGVVKGSMYMTFPTGNDMFIGKVGKFRAVRESDGGGVLIRRHNDKDSAVAGTKGFRWLPSSMVTENNIPVDISYYEGLKSTAVSAISVYGDPNMILPSI